MLHPIDYALAALGTVVLVVGCWRFVSGSIADSDNRRAEQLACEILRELRAGPDDGMTANEVHSALARRRLRFTAMEVRAAIAISATDGLIARGPGADDRERRYVAR